MIKGGDREHAHRWRVVAAEHGPCGSVETIHYRCDCGAEMEREPERAR